MRRASPEVAFRQTAKNKTIQGKTIIFFRNIYFIEHAIFVSKKTYRYTFHSSSKVRRQSFSDSNWKVPKCVTQPNDVHLQCDTLDLECFCSFSHTFFSTAKIKIDARKGDQCTTLWLLNGFLSHEMFNLLS